MAEEQDAFSFGDVVEATGRLGLPRNMPDFDRRAYLGQRHVYLELQATNFDVKGPGAGVGGIAAWLRARYTDGLNVAVDPPHAAMLMGIVLGIKHGIPTELEQALIATGLIHLLVLSGLKVAVFARIVQGALRPILGRRDHPDQGLRRDEHHGSPDRGRPRQRQDQAGVARHSVTYRRTTTYAASLMPRMSTSSRVLSKPPKFVR